MTKTGRIRLSLFFTGHFSTIIKKRNEQNRRFYDVGTVYRVVNFSKFFKLTCFPFNFYPTSRNTRESLLSNKEELCKRETKTTRVEDDQEEELETNRKSPRSKKPV